MNQIRWSPKAARQLRKIKDHRMQLCIYDEVQALRDFPHTPNVKHLTDAQCAYRLRVGGYRVLFDFDGSMRTILIQEVRKRDERTY